jgi:hypothetical protein
VSLRRRSIDWGKVPGNRKVSRSDFLAARADMRGAGLEACLEEEGGTRGKHGFPRGSGEERSDVG